MFNLIHQNGTSSVVFIESFGCEFSNVLIRTTDENLFSLRHFVEFMIKIRRNIPTVDATLVYPNDERSGERGCLAGKRAINSIPCNWGYSSKQLIELARNRNSFVGQNIELITTVKSLRCFNKMK